MFQLFWIFVVCFIVALIRPTEAAINKHYVKRGIPLDYEPKTDESARSKSKIIVKRQADPADPAAVAPPPDAGVPPPDAGDLPPDAGVPPPDAGVSSPAEVALPPNAGVPPPGPGAAQLPKPPKKVSTLKGGKGFIKIFKETAKQAIKKIHHTVEDIFGGFDGVDDLIPKGYKGPQADSDESEEESPQPTHKPSRKHHHHHHHHHHYTGDEQYEQKHAVIASKKEARHEAKQLESKGGGFNANINQNNNFSPSFGNIGDIGSLAMQGRELASNRKSDTETKSSESKPTRTDLRRYEQYLEKYFNMLKHLLVQSHQSDRKGPEYFFDFRHFYLPNVYPLGDALKDSDDSGSSSSESDSREDTSLESDELFGRAAKEAKVPKPKPTGASKKKKPTKKKDQKKKKSSGAPDATAASGVTAAPGAPGATDAAAAPATPAAP